MFQKHIIPSDSTIHPLSSSPIGACQQAMVSGDGPFVKMERTLLNTIATEEDVLQMSDLDCLSH